MKKIFDIIIFGATGYTGRFAVREAIKIFKDSNWAIAGRNKEKLEKVLHEAGNKMNTDLSRIPIILADVDDEKSIKEMTAKGKVIVNCCGPYYLYGESVVKACIDSATSHVDISGEPQFIEKMQLKYHDLAREKGIYIVSACGLESIPVEMGLNLMEKQFNGTINSVESYLRIFMDKGIDASGPSINSGTYFSAVHAVKSYFEMIKIRKQLYPVCLPTLKPALKNRLIHKKKIGEKPRWCIPLIEPDPSTVMRSQRYFYENEKKRPIQLHSYLVMNKFQEVIGCLLIGMFILLFSPLGFTRNLLIKYPQFFTFGVFSTAGPEQKKVENTNFETVLFGSGWSKGTKIDAVSPNKKMVIKISGKNPGYGATSIALLLSAKTILNESEKMPGKGGVIAPGMAFRDTNLINELKNNGIFFEIGKTD